MAATSRHSSPLYVEEGGGPPRVLERLTLGDGGVDGGRREKFVQDLVHEHPHLIPMADIEPAFSPLIPICTELPTLAGYLDNLWLTPAGGIVLGECKLARNPQARREVIAQGLDYARALNAWGYEDLEEAVRKALGDKRVTLWSLVEEQSSLTEGEFVDAVQRRLVLGRFLVLIIGDGIQEGVESLTAFLQLHAGLHTGLALVDLSLWRGVGEGIVVVPRVPMKTVIIERGVVTVDPASGARVIPPAATAAIARGTVKERAVSISEPEFYDQLETKRPGLAAKVRSLVTTLAEQVGAEPEFKKALMIRAPIADGETLTLAMIDTGGKVWLSGAWGSANKLGRASAGESYERAVAGLIGGQVKTYTSGTWPEVMSVNGKAPDIEGLLAVMDGWVGAMVEFVGAAGRRL